MGEVFGPYRLEEIIGRGGMGEVWRAFDTVKGRTVALKRLPSALADDAEFQARFRRESALAARLAEPHIIPIHDFGQIDGCLYIDMRLVEGRDLASVVAEHGPMHPRRAVGIIAQVAAALDAAHAADLVHRDVKPSNVIVRGAGEDEFAYLIDFGIARAVAGTSTGPSLTAAGATIGTLDYMAPERFDTGRIDGRADVYSLGCMLFELLTGSAPFSGRSLAALIHAHLALDPPRPSGYRPGLPPGLDAVVAHGMAKNPEHRYPTAGALVAAARAALAAATPPPAPAPPTVVPRPLASFVGQPGWPLPPAQFGHVANQPAFRTQPPRPEYATATADRPGVLVAVLVLQLLSATALLVFAFSALFGLITSSDPATLVGNAVGGGLFAVFPAFYLWFSILAFKGRGWARWTVTVLNVLSAIVLVIALFNLSGPDNAGLLVVILAVIVLCTVPMFTPAARRYFAAARVRR